MSDVSEIDVQSSRSNAIPVWVGTFGQWVSKIDPDIFLMTERELESGFVVTQNDYFLRKRFWELTEKYLQIGKKDAELSEIFEGICKKQHFYKNVLGNPYRLSWLLIPVSLDKDKIEFGFYRSIKEAMSVLDLPTNEKTAGPKLKALEFFANRHLGPVIQRIEQKSMNVNVDASRSVSGPIDQSELEQQMAELKSKFMALPATKVEEPE